MSNWNKEHSPSILLCQGYLDRIYEGDTTDLTETDLKRAFYAGILACFKTVKEIGWQANVDGKDGKETGTMIELFRRDTMMASLLENGAETNEQTK